MKSTVDLTFLRSLMGNDERVVEKFVNIFRSQIPRQLQELKLHYTSEDWPSVSIVAHSIKSQLGYLGPTSLGSQIARIETMVDEGDTNQLGGLIHSFMNDMNAFLEELA